jgi:hypothetical protein
VNKQDEIFELLAAIDTSLQRVAAGIDECLVRANRLCWELDAHSLSLRVESRGEPRHLHAKLTLT